MKRNFWLAFVAMMLAMVMVFGLVGCSTNNSTPNDNSNVEQTTPDVNNNEPNGSENSDQNNGSNDVENNVNNGNENTEPDVNGDVNNGTNDDNNGDSDNDTNNGDSENGTNNGDNGSTGDDSNTNNNVSTNNFVGIGIYVCSTNEVFPYANNAKINGELTTLVDGTEMYTFGDFQALYVIEAYRSKPYDLWALRYASTSNIVYCSGVLNEHNDGTFFACLGGTYVDISSQDLCYYFGRIYNDNGNYYLIVDNNKNSIAAGDYTMSEYVNVLVGDTIVEVEVYFSFQNEMFDGIYDSYEFVFYNSAGTVVDTFEYSVRNLPKQIVWKSEYEDVTINQKYNGETLLSTDIRGALIVSEIVDGFVCNTILDGIGYCYTVSWVVNTEN